MRVVGLRLRPGQRVPEHRNAIPVAVIVTEGELCFSEGAGAAQTAHAGELVLVAHCHLRNDRRTFRLERIVQLTRVEAVEQPGLFDQVR